MDHDLFSFQGNNNWLEWQKDVLGKRNAVENVYQWACGYVFVNFVVVG
jgi:hypothetical protein